MFKQVKIIKGMSQYDIFQVWSEAVKSAFTKMGIPAALLNVSDSMHFVDEDTLTLGFNMSRTWAVENVHQCHFAWLVDHPVFHAEYFMPEIQKIPVNRSNCIAGCVSEDWTKCGRMLYPGHDVHFLPHATTLFDALEPDWDNRIIDVVFFGSIQDPEILLEFIKKKSNRFWPFIQQIIQSHIANDKYITPDYLILDVLLAQKLDPAQTIIMMNAFFPLIDQYLRNLKRVELLNKLKDITIHVFGNGPWQSFALPENIVIHDSIPYQEAIRIMRQSKILLNHTPTLAGGGHERIFDALSSGCAVVTTHSAFLYRQPGMTEGVVFYDPMHLETVHEQIQSILNNPDQGEVIRPAQEQVQRKHTMVNRAEKIWQLANNKWKQSAPAFMEELAGVSV